MIDESSAGRVRCTVGERRIGEVTVLAVTGTVDTLTAPVLEDAITRTGGSRALVVDLTDVDFLSSVGMGVLAAAHADLMPSVRFAVVADGPATSRPLTLIGLTDLIRVVPALDDALRFVADGHV